MCLAILEKQLLILRILDNISKELTLKKILLLGSKAFQVPHIEDQKEHPLVHTYIGKSISVLKESLTWIMR